MADFIEPIIDWAIAALKAATPKLLDEAKIEQFGEYRRSWVGASQAWPPIAVLPKNTQFDPEGQARHSASEITIRFGVSDMDPDEVTVKAMRVMKIVDRVIDQAAWPVAEGSEDGTTFTRVFVAQHDYGPLYTGKDGGFARFPEMHIEVEVYEL